MNRIYGGLKSRPYNQRELVVKECVTHTFSGVPVISVASGASVQIVQYTPPVDLTDDEFAFSATSALAEASGVFEDAPTLINTHNLTVTYSSSNTDTATIDENGVVTVINHTDLQLHTTTIKATFAGNDDYNPKEVSYVLTSNIPVYTSPIEPEPEPTKPENTEEPTNPEEPTVEPGE